MVVRRYRSVLKFLSETNFYPLFSFRWGHYPIDEALTFGHAQVVEYMKKYEVELEAQQKAQREEEEKRAKESKTQTSTLPI